MESDKDRASFEITTVPKEKNGGQRFEKKTIIFAVVALIVIIIIIVAVSLGVILSQEVDNGDTNSLTTTRYPIILISADGFRSEYLSRGLTPNITKLGNDGVRAKFLLSQFPTKTFPNHYSIVTGLYPESHGIVFNSFYDPVLRRRFSIRGSRNPIFWKNAGEPIWITANKTGLKSAAYYWVGSEVKGMRTNYYRDYNQSVPFSERVKQVLEWLQLPEKERPSIIFLYFHEPDYAGHGTGTDSATVRKQIRLVDDSIGQLMLGLEDMRKSDSVNVILVSDHGMSTVNCSNAIFLDKYGLKKNELYITNAGSVLSFNTKRRSNREKVFNMIKCRNDFFQSFYKRNLPRRMHFSNNRRIDDIIVLANEREVVSVNSTARTRCLTGQHGYDNILPDMQTIFLAKGPSFEKGKVVEHFSNIEIYNLLAGLLKIEPAPNNGTIGSLNSLLVPDARSLVLKSHGDGTVFRTDICEFPSKTDFKSCSKCCVSTSCNISRNDINEANKIFDMTAKEAKSYQKEHLPWGLPEGGLGVEACLLSQPYFITGYSTDLRIPLWTANRLNGKQLSQNDEIENCYRSDVRLTKNQSASCSSYNNSGFDQGQLVPSRDMNFDRMAMLSTSTFSNVVPTYRMFGKGIWKRLENKIRDWAIKYDTIYVITGTIFDVDADGIEDKKISTKRRVNTLPENPAIPTHFYKIVTRCETNATPDYTFEKCDGTVRVISFILEHTDDHCEFQSYDKLLLQNVAPVRDIELLTGINFFSELPQQLQVEIKTFVPVQLWS